MILCAAIDVFFLKCYNVRQIHNKRSGENTKGRKRVPKNAMEQKKKELEYREGRLMDVERAARMNACWYACFAALTAALGLIYPDGGFQTLTALTTMALSIWTVLVCANRGAARAQRIRSERAAIERIFQEMETSDDVRCAQTALSAILSTEDAAGSHEQRAIRRMGALNAPDESAPFCGYEKFLYWFVEIAGMTAEALILLAPVAAVVLAAVGLL